MRAVVIREAGGAITVEDRPVRDPGPGEVRIRVTAAAVNPADIFLWRTLGGRAVKLPVTPGMDAAGTVEGIGDGVDRLAAGDAVIAVVNPRLPEGGAQAELVIVPEASVAPMPRGVSPVAASTLPMTGLTALEGLGMLDLVSGGTLAVTGGAGLMASYIIPFAKQRGLRVIADAKPDDEAFVASLGADHVVPRGDGFVDAVRELAPGGVDAVFDTAALTRGALAAIRDGGAIAVIRGWDDQGEPERGITVHLVSVGNAMQRTDWLQLLADEAAAGHLQLRVAGLYPPERTTGAYQLMDVGGLRGRAVITF